MVDEKRDVPYFIDKAGRETKVGDFILYGHNLGRCAGMRFGKVLKIEIVTNSWSGDREDWRIRVQGINDDWNTDINDLKLAGKGTLQYPERTMNIGSLMPIQCQEILMEGEK